jgi:acetyl/propionyl-CoA carboxylase alpha subunit
MRAGLDLVRAQVEIAAGGPLPRRPALRGHAIEARLNAEDPYHGYLPQTGTALLLAWPDGEGVRVDAGVAGGQSIHAHYDSLLAKIVAHGADREEARGRLIAALESLALLGVVTNQSFLLDLLHDRAFVRAETFTHTLESREWPGPAGVPDEALLAATIALHAPVAAGASGRDDADRFSPRRRVGRWGRDGAPPSEGGR